MKIRLWVWLSIIIAATSAIGIGILSREQAVQTDRQQQQDFAAGWKEIHRLYGSDEAIEVVRNPEQVLLQSVQYHDELLDLKRATLSKAVVLPIQMAGAISQDLLNPLIFLPSKEFTACAPIWAFKITFKKGNKVVNSLYCPGCMQILIDPTGQEELANLNQHAVIEAGSGAIEKAAQTYFPHVKLHGE